MDKTFSGLLTFSIISGYFILAVSLLWFLGISGNTAVNVIGNDGLMTQIFLNPYKYRYANIGAVYVITFGGAGLIFLYVFLISPLLEKQHNSAQIGKISTPGSVQPTAPGDNTAQLKESMLSGKYEEEHKILFSKGDQIDIDGIKNFIRFYPETALQFATGMNSENIEIDDYTKRVFVNWEIKGLNQQIIQNEIRNMAGIGYFGNKINFEQALNNLTDAIVKEREKFN